jgi:chromosome segregation ATPase
MTTPKQLIARARELALSNPFGPIVVNAELLTELADALETVTRERDEARASNDFHARLNQYKELAEARDEARADAKGLERQRDEARAENARLEHSLSDAMEQMAAIQDASDRVAELEQYIDTLDERYSSLKEFYSEHQDCEVEA